MHPNPQLAPHLEILDCIRGSINLTLLHRMFGITTEITLVIQITVIIVITVIILISVIILLAMELDQSLDHIFCGHSPW